MKCEACSQPLFIFDTKVNSPVGTDEVIQTQYLVCKNPECAKYYGSVENPKYAKTIQHKIGG